MDDEKDNEQQQRQEQQSPLDDICQCGRPKVPKHCPYCGRRDYYGVGRMAKMVNVKLDNGELKQVLIRVWKCRVCQEYFDTTTQCTASPKPLSVAAQRAYDAAQSVMGGGGKLFDTRQERMSKLNELFGNKKKGQQ